MSACLLVSTLSHPTDILPGQGLYYTTTTQSWRAKDCNLNNYGVTNKTYGLTPYPCRDCPANMVTSTDTVNYPVSSSFYAPNGFISALACVTADGWGYNGRIAQKCDSGYYQRHDTRLDCVACAYGLTTPGPGLGITIADCGMKPGYGYSNGAIRECPIGESLSGACMVAVTVAVLGTLGQF